MGGNAVEIEHLSKVYRLGEHKGVDTLRDLVTSKLRRTGSGPSREVWSLRDVSMEVAEGEAVGIIGRNGAGKSTLLKVLARITEPTSGVARTRGRVASLLEVGTGFHNELTGRENIYLNAAIHGLTRRDVGSRFERIVEFSGVERFLDTPVKRYSSGMALRLAFAVAAHLEPEIMVVDEVLAVGDAEFQRKCLSRMSEAGREGRTVLFVSHDLDALARLCRRVVWLDRGEVVMEGEASETISAYLQSGADRQGVRRFPDHGGSVWLESVEVRGPTDQPVSVLARADPLSVVARVHLRRRAVGLDLSVYVTSIRGVTVLDEAWRDTDDDRVLDPGTYDLRLRVPPVLNVGEYAVGVWLGEGEVTLFEEPSAALFSLEGSTANRPDRAVVLSLPWDVRPA
jgi:ABC-type polysaccharide/polyol phosphate transport system ATPase subunit